MWSSEYPSTPSSRGISVSQLDSAVLIGQGPAGPVAERERVQSLIGASSLVNTLKDIGVESFKEAFNGLKLGVSRVKGSDSQTEPWQATSERALNASESIVSYSQSVTDKQHRLARFTKLLSEPVVDLEALRKLAWGGIPAEVRPDCWRLLLGYMPPAKSRQASSLARKRAEYIEMVPQFYDVPAQERSEDEAAALRQVQVDVPRTAPSIVFFQGPAMQKSLERLLYIWGLRHPASGYVQGMNDLVTPFVIVFLGEHLTGNLDGWVIDSMDEDALLQVEADCYWCLCKLVEGIQDHYTYAQPGIQRAVFSIQKIVSDRDPALASKLSSEGVDFIQFAWRWVNCLLIRELPLALAPRLWDNYLVEGTGMRDFLLLLCAEFLLQWRSELLNMEFQEIIMFLQRPPTSEWGERELVQLLSRASYHTIDKSRMMKDEKAIML